MKLKQAQRSQVKLRIGLSGPSGYGKTMSALLLAYGITQDWKKIAVIDTENNSASLYSHLGEFNVLNLEEPYTPHRYIEAIKTCEDAEMEVIIVDSISHEWSGKGGCLEMHEKLGGRFQDWAKVTPLHNQFIDALVQSKSHILVSTRRKVDYSLDKDMNGKTRVMKLGTKEIQREGLEYELTVNFEFINDNHLVKASKDRTGLFMDKPEFVINQATGKKLKSWCSEGVSLEAIKKEISMCHNLAGLKHIYDKYPSLHKELYPLIIERKNIIEDSNSQVIEENKVQQPKN
ncbi:signal recognition particle subunit FFH/SRP54 (srp54) [Salegentibacter sp. 24]|uniref:AAA family ATPase n=1 Tax=Salegentibacter sp. 24 TaxID=2183986 RepID=UPI00105E397D|nr:AAA family ATPase [Salegentibacter sp. 24]TDN95313.1 signal recognition particle subunit FFH/SRP54 (srp54) [Salegentibacter sp. 24]